MDPPDLYISRADLLLEMSCDGGPIQGLTLCTYFTTAEVVIALTEV